MTSKKKARGGGRRKRAARFAGTGDGDAAERIFTAFERRMIEAGERKDGPPAGPNPAPPEAPKGDPLPDDDARLWAALSRTVKPLPRRRPVPPAPTPPGQSPPGQATAPESPRGSATPEPKAKPAPRPRRVVAPPPPTPAAPTGPPVLSHGDSPGVDKRTSAKLRRGLMPIEATLDLHGLGRDMARDRLTAFITGHHAAGRRCVLVITGKGLKEDWTPGVIRTSVPEWLNAPPLRPLVLSFATAQPQHGGSGAIYVLLKRAR